MRHFLKVLLLGTILVSGGLFSSDAAADRTATWNYGQHVLLALEAKEALETEDATKKITVEGAEPMQESQGDNCEGATDLVSTNTNTPMSATTISASAEAMNSLLQLAKIDLSLLSTDIAKKPEEEEEGQPLSASAGKPGTDANASQKTGTTSEDEEDLTTEEERELRRRRALLLNEWATAATQIGEGSNAISHAFYDRAAGFAEAANEAFGSLGGTTTITDTDRFVLFELTRGAALSAIQLGLDGAMNLNDMSDMVMTKVDEDEEDSSSQPLSAGAAS